MIFNYTLSDAQRWAAFSGDYNPIHFDLQHAQRFGQQALTVHGMRAMLDIKYQLSTGLLPCLPATDFLRFNTRLRQPVLCNTPTPCNLSKGQGKPLAIWWILPVAKTVLTANCAAHRRWYGQKASIGRSSRRITFIS